jgi:hypothetical protein
MLDPPAGMMTFLFTDIETNTRLPIVATMCQPIFQLTSSFPESGRLI